MEINFEYHDVTASDILENYTRERLKKIEKKFSFVNMVDVYFDTENTTSDETGMKCGIRANVPGTDYFAESSKETFQKAVSEAVSELETQLQKKKEKMTTY